VQHELFVGGHIPGSGAFNQRALVQSPSNVH
jgi:hypothetical protein